MAIATAAATFTAVWLDDGASCAILRRFYGPARKLATL